jgi:hypothetical protein
MRAQNRAAIVSLQHAFEKPDLVQSIDPKRRNRHIQTHNRIDLSRYEVILIRRPQITGLLSPFVLASVFWRKRRNVKVGRLGGKRDRRVCLSLRRGVEVVFGCGGRWAPVTGWHALWVRMQCSEPLCPPRVYGGY